MAFTKWITLWTNISLARRAIRSRFDLVPKSIEISSCSMVVSDVISWVCDPIRSNRNVGLHHLECLQWADSKVILQHILSFNAILNKEVMPTNLVANIALYIQIMHSMQGEDPSEWIMDRITNNIRIRDISVHVEVDAIPTDYPWLPTMSELCIGHMRYQSLFCLSHHYQVGAILFFHWCFCISHHLNVSAQQTDLCPHLQFHSTKVFLCSNMPIIEGLSHSDSITIDGWYLPFFCLPIGKWCRSYNDLLTHLPIHTILHCQGWWTSWYGGAESGPSFGTSLSIHRKLALYAKYPLIP